MSNQIAFNGYAFIHGTTQDGATVTVEGYAQVFLPSATVTLASDFTEHRGGDGGFGALQWTGERLEMTITFRPASDQSEALANAKAVLIENGARVNLSGVRQVYYKGVDVMNGSWLNVGQCQVGLSDTNPGEVTLNIKNYLASQATLLNRVPDA